jgi:ATP-binding protein involved in chromosome partitioning
MSKVDSEKVWQALKKVKYPGFSRDIVSFGVIKDVTTEGSTVKFNIEVKTQNPQIVQEIEQNARMAIEELDGVDHVFIQKSVSPGGPTESEVRPPDTLLLKGIKHKIAVASGKGGVGKSTVSVNLAVALAKSKAKVGLLDGDIYGPSIPLMFGMQNEKVKSDGQKVLPMERYGVKFISIGFFLDPDLALVWRGPMVGKALEQLMTDVEWGSLDYLIIDLPPGTGDAQLTLSQRIHLSGAVIVTTPQDVALIDAKKGVNMFEKVNVPIIGIIENMSYFICPHCNGRTEIFSHGGGEREAKKMGVPFLGKIPIDQKIRIGGDEGIPYVAMEEKTLYHEVFMEMAEQVKKIAKI